MKNTLFLMISLFGLSGFVYAAVPQGDCDGANGVNIQDVACTIADLQAPQPSVDADCTGEGNENIADVLCVIDVILGNLTAPILTDASDVVTPVNTAITPIILSNTGGAAASCSVSPALSAGLSVVLNSPDCEITGTPTAVTSLNTYTITATNATGSNAATVNITINFEQFLNDTGITWGGDYPSGNNTTCTGDTINAQDCSHGRDALAAAGQLTKTGAGSGGFDFTKLDSNGNALAASAANWSCVRDNHTGLVWEVKTTAAGIHHKDNTYQWGGNTALGKNHPNKQGTYYDDWNTLVDGSNSANFCGFNDWRVPKIESLRSIVDYGRHNPSIDTAYFPNTTANPFWSSSPFSFYSDYAWLLVFNYGYDGGDDFYRGSSYRVRLVRGGQ